MKIRIFNNILEVRLRIYRLPNQQVVGITNRTQDGYFVLFADYDLVDYDVVLDDVRFLQRNYDLGTVIVLATQEKVNNLVDKVSGSYHVVGFTKYTFPEIKEMLKLIRCDEHFKTAYKYQSRCWVLRVGEKYWFDGSIAKETPILKQVVVSKTNRVANLAMLRFWEKQYNVSLEKYFRKKDKTKRVEIIHYVTSDKRWL